MHTVFLSYRRVHSRGAMELPPFFYLAEVFGMNKEISHSNWKERNYSRELILAVVLTVLLLVSIL